MATHSNILAWRIPWTEEPSGSYSPWGHKESDMTEQLALSESADRNPEAIMIKYADFGALCTKDLETLQTTMYKRNKLQG